MNVMIHRVSPFFHIIIKVHLVAPYDLDFICNVTT